MEFNWPETASQRQLKTPRMFVVKFLHYEAMKTGFVTPLPAWWTKSGKTLILPSLKYSRVLLCGVVEYLKQWGAYVRYGKIF